MALPLVSYPDFLSTDWSLNVGSPLAGYDVDKLTDRDPSNPLKIVEVSIELEGDLGSAKRVDVVTLHHHNFQEGTTLHLQMGTSTSWSSPSSVDMTVDVGPWSDDGFAPHVCFDVVAAYPVEGNRTFRYLRILNIDPNDVPVAIGEIVVGGVLQLLTRGMQLALSAGTMWGISYVEGKKGPRYVHDRRTRARTWWALVSMQSSDWTAFRNVLAASKAMAYPMLVWPTNSLSDEPILGRWAGPTLTETFIYTTVDQVNAAFEELSCGEAY
jgi:hypothetical protein